MRGRCATDRKEQIMSWDVVHILCYGFILFDWIYMKIKYGEWSKLEALMLIALALFITAAKGW